MMEEYFTPGEVAKTLKISRVFVYKLIRERKISSVRIGRVVRIPNSRLQKWLEENENADKIVDEAVKEITDGVR
jgi:excisionase family DNA binding protein